MELAIIGMGALFPKADSLDQYWANIKNGVDAITEVPDTHWRPEDYFSEDQKKPDFTYGRRGGFLNQHAFDPLKYGIPPKVIEATDTSQLLGLVAAEAAMRDAGYGPEADFDRDRVSVILGITGALELVIPLGSRLGHPKWRRAMAEAGVAPEVIEQVAENISESYVSWQEDSFPGLLGNVVAGRISKHLDTGGTNCVVDAACASSISAIHLASLELGAGRADMVISGGVDTFNDIFMYMCFSKTPALSPSGNARPFDNNGDGTILGEGLGMLVLKRLEDAERDGDKIYAVLKGIGSSSDGKGEAIYAPSSPGQEKAIRNAYQSAGVSPKTIELVEAHGTGTKKGDAVEAAAIKRVFGEASDRQSSWCALGSVKSQIGHTKAAAGAAGIIKAALALHHKVLPPTIKVDEPHEELRPGETPFYINSTKRPWVSNREHPRRAAVSSFGFGGSNFHAVLEEYAPEKKEPDWDGNTQIFAFSADNTAELKSKLLDLPGSDEWRALRARAANSRAEFQHSAAHRLLLVLENDRTSLAELASKASQLLEADGPSTAPGIYYGYGPVDGGMAFVFPGQGAQYPDMLRDVSCLFPEMLDTLARADDVLRGAIPERRLSEYIYPHPAFDKETAKRSEDALRATDVAQPAIGAVTVGAIEILRAFGIQPDAVAGHSYGELCALYAAGVLDEEALIAVSRLRGELMGGGSGEKGGMLAVRSPIDDIERVLDENSIELIVANRNAPEQAVLSGATTEVDRAFEVFKVRKIGCSKLAVAAAFHSEFVADAQEPLRAALDDIDFREPRLPVYSNTTGTPYPDDVAAAKELLASQLAQPVRFVDEILAMYEGGVRTFIEVGPGGRMTGLVKAILGERPHSAFALDASNGKNSGVADLARCLSQVAATGQKVSLELWDAAYTADTQAVAKPRMTVQISGANYRAPRQPRAETPRAGVPESKSPAKAPIPAAIPPPSAPAIQTSAPAPEKPPTVPSPPAPVLPPPAPARSAPPGELGTLLEQTQANIVALQQMQERTARLHSQFLQGQEDAAKTFQTLLQQQQRVLRQGGVATTPVAQVPTTAPPVEAAPSMPPAPTEAAAEVVPRPAAAMLQAPTSIASGALERTLLEVVSEKTGYPTDMLELDMVMDADLGIDSIKRVEILSAMQDRLPELPTVEAEVLGRLQTLRDIVEQMASLEMQAVPESASTAVPDEDHLRSVLISLVSEKTGYPVDMLDVDMRMDADLGIDSIKRVEILSALQERIPSLPTLEAEDLGKLQTLSDVLKILGERRPVPASGPARVAVESKPPGDVTRKTIHLTPLAGAKERQSVLLREDAVIWVSDDDDGLAAAIVERFHYLGFDATTIDVNTTEVDSVPERLDGLIIVAPRDVDDLFLKRAFARTQQLAAPLLRAGKTDAAVFATVARMDGAFGLLQGCTMNNAASGGLAGLAKTAAHEWPEVSCKAVDAAPSTSNIADLASHIVDELLRAGPMEVGISDEACCTTELRYSPLADAPSPFNSDDVIVISGGGRGVTAEVAVAIADSAECKLVLLGRSPSPTPEEAWLAGLSDESQIKKSIMERSGNTLDPKEFNEAFAAIVSNRELMRTLRRIRDAGAEVHYYAVDTRDAEDVARALHHARDELGPITGLIHGAGVISDKRIEEKTSESFDRVYDTKVVGMRALLSATENDPLKAIVLFSSSTARFGRKGQVDYAMANEVLNKSSQALARIRPECRVVSVNWGPWDGGMVTPSLKKIFEEEGVEVIGLKEGAAYLLREIAAEDAPAEVVAIGGPPVTEVRQPDPERSNPGASEDTALDLELSVDRHPFLQSHVIDGKPVLPVALYVEWMAHAALHANPGLRFHGVEGLRVLKGVILDDSAPCPLRVTAAKADPDDGVYRVAVELSGWGSGDATLHSRADVLLVDRLPKGERTLQGMILGEYPHPHEEIYGDAGAEALLFHGEQLRGINEVEGYSEHGIVGMAHTAPRPPEWIEDPWRKSWLADPLILDSAFQLMILWSRQKYGAASLPVAIGSYSQFLPAFPKGRVQIVIRVNEDSEHRALSTIEFMNPKNGVLIARITDYECVIDASLNTAFVRNKIRIAPTPASGPHDTLKA